MRWLLVVALLGLIGCSADHGRFGPYYTPRVTAAKAIDDPGLRDDTLRQVGRQAIDGGDAIAAADAVDAIQEQQLKDELAARSARTLNSRQQWGQATSMAKKISDVNLRDRVLAEIATGRS
jgi:hypothetical protein